MIKLNEYNKTLNNGCNEEKKIACESAVNSLIQNFWNSISETTAISTTIEYELEDHQKDEISKILSSIIDETTIHIGMLYKIIDILNNKTIDLIDAGQEKAENLISDNEADKTVLVKPIANEA